MLQQMHGIRAWTQRCCSPRLQQQRQQHLVLAAMLLSAATTHLLSSSARQSWSSSCTARCQNVDGCQSTASAAPTRPLQTSADPGSAVLRLTVCASSFLQPILVHRQQIRASSPAWLCLALPCINVAHCVSRFAVHHLVWVAYWVVCFNASHRADADVCYGVVTGNVQEVKPVSIQPRVAV